MSSSEGLGPVVSIAATAGGAQIHCRDGSLWVEVIADGVARVRATPAGRWPAPRDWEPIVLPTVPPTDVVVTQGEDAVVVDGRSLRAEIARSDGSVRFITAGGVEVAADAGPGAIVWFDDRVLLRKRRHRDERHAGFGQRPRLDQTAGTKTAWNVNAKHYGPATDEMYCTVPVFIAHGGPATYGVALNATGWARIEADPGSDEWIAEVRGADLDYVVAAGDRPADVAERLTALIGRIELPPRWAIGYHQTRWGYDSAAKIAEVAEQFTKRRLPCDVIHIDIDYMDRHRVFTWDAGRFPDPAHAIAELERRGLRAVAIVDPGVAAEPGNPVYDAGLVLDAFLRHADGRHVTGHVWPGRCVFPDFLRADVRRWWASLHTTIVDAGVAGVWNDMNEPALYDGPVGAEQTANVVEMPADAVHDAAGSAVAHEHVHNRYGVEMARAASDALVELRPTKRSFLLSRSGHTGIQRFAAVWTGDNTASWEQLRMSLPMLCNLGLSGVPFVGADIGGFFGDATPELFARWMQAGVLYPLMRGHSHKTSQPNEPWAFGEEIEVIADQALRLRYQLRPYLYSLFREAATTGAPILRPMLWAHSDDPTAAAVEDQALLGDALLAAPVLAPGVRRRDVYLPAGVWFDWYSGVAYAGPGAIGVDAPLDRLVLFARAGSVVPLATVSDDGSIDDSIITLRVFPGTGAGLIYDDDGESFAYRAGVYALRSYSVREAAEGTVVTLSPTAGSYRRPGCRWRVVLNVGDPIDFAGELDDEVRLTWA